MFPLKSVHIILTLVYHGCQSEALVQANVLIVNPDAWITLVGDAVRGLDCRCSC